VNATQSIDGQSHLQRFINPKRSKGSYFTDTDGNVVLDLDCPAAIGYNHDVAINARDSDFYDKFLSGKSNVSNVAPAEYVDALRENIMPIAPSGMVQVHVADGSVTNANDTALKLAL
jgi:4-aminobutyrate aminotransferase-like enzyme